MKKICVFGASITSGCNDFKNGGWCDTLKRELLNKGVLTFNLGISGDDTYDLLKRIKGECEARQPDIIIIALGGNDSQYLLRENEYRVSKERFSLNFEKIISISKDFTKEIIFVGLTGVDEEKINLEFKKKDKKYENKKLKEYDLEIERIAIKNKLDFIPLFDLIKKEDLDDGLHPTAEGHSRILKRIMEQKTIAKLMS